MDVKPDQVPIARPRSLGRKGCADQRQAAGHQQRAADSLQRAGGDELADIRRKRRTTPTPTEKNDIPIAKTLRRP